MCILETAHISFCNHEIIELCPPAFIKDVPCPPSLSRTVTWPLIGWCRFCISEMGSEEEAARLAVLAEEAERWFYGDGGPGEETVSCSSDSSSSSGYSSGDSSSSESDGEDECDCLKW